MSYKILHEMFAECLARPYTTVENGASFDARIEDGTLYLFFEPSNGREDWNNNLNFRVRPYDDMKPAWYCHAGFLRVFKSVLPYLEPYIEDRLVRRIVTVGYSHGGALAILCHEAAVFRRPDLRDHIKTFAYGAPRVLFAPVPRAVKKRFRELYLVQNEGDLVTHLPPAVLGFRHVGNIISIGEKGTYTAIDAHRPESYLAVLAALI
jgi:hypothetical protein